MTNSKNITATEGRLTSNINNLVRNSINNSGIEQRIIESAESSKPHSGVVVKFYPHLDKALVKLSNNKSVYCHILHLFGGELLDLFTPLGEKSFCETLREPCVVPRAELNCFVTDIGNKTSHEWLLVGYYNNEELIGVNPAEPGNVKIVTRGGMNQFWIKFGYDGLDLRLPNTATINKGEMNDDMEPVDYASAGDVYTRDEVYCKDEVYTKDEVDELIKKAIEEALDDNDDGDGEEENNDTTGGY